jgi:hypothetical protein
MHLIFFGKSGVTVVHMIAWRATAARRVEERDRRGTPKVAPPARAVRGGRYGGSKDDVWEIRG